MATKEVSDARNIRDGHEHQNNKDRRIVFTSSRKVFMPSEGVTHNIATIWKSRFTGAWNTWKKVSKEEREGLSLTFENKKTKVFVDATTKGTWERKMSGGFPSGAKNEWGLSPKAKVQVLHTAQLDVTSGNGAKTFPKWIDRVGSKNGTTYGVGDVDEYVFQPNIEELSPHNIPNVDIVQLVDLVKVQQLLGPRNYAMWKAQMLCLMDSQKMRGIVELDQKWPWPGAKSVNMAKQYEILLKGWVFGSIKEEVLKNVVQLESAWDVWNGIGYLNDPELLYQQASNPSDDHMMPVLEDIKIELGSSTDTSRSRKLVEATLKGTWWEAKAILQNRKEAFTEGLDHCGNTMLHIAVAQGHNYFVEKLLNFIEDGEQIETINSNGFTALHIASFFDNRYAAELLVKKRKELIILDSYKGHLPLHTAFHNMKLSTYVYLLEVHEKEGRHLPLERYPREDVQTGIAILVDAIFRKRYDLGLSLAKIYPELVVKDDQVLMAMAIAFPNELGFWETLVDPSSSNIREKIKL
uniref:Uncharacterized protein n=1 Tax=Tanacetum cinerariifolium TaxID=118510 RepID=A0A6L2MJK2_TANCI|nr:hypothetical protein [Tanacetum cinerariifolium]